MAQVGGRGAYRTDAREVRISVDRAADELACEACAQDGCWHRHARAEAGRAWTASLLPSSTRRAGAFLSKLRVLYGGL